MAFFDFNHFFSKSNVIGFSETVFNLHFQCVSGGLSIVCDVVFRGIVKSDFVSAVKFFLSSSVFKHHCSYFRIKD